jgi:hypothetical protein
MPTPDQDWLASLSREIDGTLVEELLEFRSHARRWLNAVRLPIDQLILTLAQDIFTDAADLQHKSGSGATYAPWITRMAVQNCPLNYR